jgi:hypothetical protein
MMFGKKPTRPTPKLFSDDVIDLSIFSVYERDQRGVAWVGTEGGPGSWEVEFHFENSDLCRQAINAIKTVGLFTCMIPKNWITAA